MKKKVMEKQSEQERRWQKDGKENKSYS